MNFNYNLKMSKKRTIKKIEPFEVIYNFRSSTSVPSGHTLHQNDQPWETPIKPRKLTEGTMELVNILEPNQQLTKFDLESGEFLGCSHSQIPNDLDMSEMEESGLKIEGFKSEYEDKKDKE